MHHHQPFIRSCFIAMWPPQTMPKMVPSSGKAASWRVITRDHGLPPIFLEMRRTSKKPLVSRLQTCIWDGFGDPLLVEISMKRFTQTSPGQCLDGYQSGHFRRCRQWEIDKPPATLLIIEAIPFSLPIWKLYLLSWTSCLSTRKTTNHWQELARPVGENCA